MDNGWRCPRCGSVELDVSIRTWARLEQTLDQEENLFSTLADEAQDGDHEWDADSQMKCRECAHCEEARGFMFTVAPPGCLEVRPRRKAG
jgi:hypothetical protein